jgi:hypothetical protein
LPGVALAAIVAVVAVAAAPAVAAIAPIPAMVIALLIGIALNPLARQPLYQAGEIGWITAILVVIAITATLAAGLLLVGDGGPGQPARHCRQ